LPYSILNLAKLSRERKNHEIKRKRKTLIQSEKQKVKSNKNNRQNKKQTTKINKDQEQKHKIKKIKQE